MTTKTVARKAVFFNTLYFHHSEDRMGIIDHLGIYCPAVEYGDLANFYTVLLQPLNIVKVLEENNLVGFGRGPNGEPEFEIFMEDKDSKQSTHTPLHYAFVADTRGAVREFYKAGLDAGAKSNGGPGLRKDYSPVYYAAFLIDPIGNTIEAVCQATDDGDE